MEDPVLGRLSVASGACQCSIFDVGVAFFVCDDSVNYGYLSIHLSSVDVS